jgi:DegV family protein with EDD domain
VTEARRIALAMARGGAAAVESSRGRLNDLNVYPVPDGDTGTNLAETARELAAGLEADPSETREGLAAAATRAALRGASGNSGAILSQIVGGFAQVVGGSRGIDSKTLARALRSATEAAYKPVQQPIEGTMLTVIREMAEAAERVADRPLEEAVEAILAEGEASVVRTQGMLDVLRDAGVVDAGAAGLLEFARGAFAGLRGEEVEAPIEAIAAPIGLDGIHLEQSRYRYCTAFLVEGDAVDRETLEAALLAMGDCLLVVGEAPLVKVHVHTDDPGQAISAAVVMGAIDRVAIANMHVQAEERERRLSGERHLRAIPGGRTTEGRMTAENTAIVLDSTADMPDAASVHPSWRSVPLTVRFGDEQFRDGVDIDATAFYERLRAGGAHPSTAAPSPGAYSAVYEELADFAHVLVLPVSSQVSASAQAARIAAETPEAGGRVTVLDGLTVSAGTVLLAQGLQRLLDDGTDIDELTAWFTAARDRVSVLIYVDTLEYLRRGGRIGRTSEMVGGALGVRPLLTIRGGKIEPYKRALGRAAAMREFGRFLEAAVPDGRPARVGLAHADDAAGLERLREIVQRSRPDASIDRVCEIGAVVGTHGGPGTLGMLVLAEG